MPVPGPRNQFRPVPGYTNPDGEDPSRINRWHRPGPFVELGRSPGTMFVTLRGNVLGVGQIRRLWRQSINYMAGVEPYSWTESGPGPGRPFVGPGAFQLTRALRYMTRSIYTAAGTDNTRYAALHTTIQPRVTSKGVSVGAGNMPGRPTVRNRLTSFGSRVPPLNAKVPAGQ